MEEKRQAIKIMPNKVYWITLDKKFGEYDNQYGRSYGYGIKMRTDLDKQPVEETYFASEAVYNLIKASRAKEGVEFELILNEKDGKKFYTLDGQTTNQWAANNQNADAESASMTTEQKVQRGKDELDQLFGEAEKKVDSQIEKRDIESQNHGPSVYHPEVKHIDAYNTIIRLWEHHRDCLKLVEGFAKAEGIELKNDRMI